MALTMDGGRIVEIDPARHPHIDHGYADTGLAAKDLLNHRMAYVAV